MTADGFGNPIITAGREALQDWKSGGMREQMQDLNPLPLVGQPEM